MNKIREEFEAWVKRYAEEINYVWKDKVLNRDGSHYKTTWVDSAWIGWQASRESLVVELPELPSVHDGYTKHEIDFMAYAVDTCKDAIEAAGIKVVSK